MAVLLEVKIQRFTYIFHNQHLHDHTIMELPEKQNVVLRVSKILFSVVKFLHNQCTGAAQKKTE